MDKVFKSFIRTKATQIQKYHTIFSSNSSQIMSLLYFKIKYLLETENHFEALPLTINNKVHINTISQIISMQSPSLDRPIYSPKIGLKIIAQWH